jgi:hypothetical protein
MSLNLDYMSHSHVEEVAAPGILQKQSCVKYGDMTS